MPTSVTAATSSEPQRNSSGTALLFGSFLFLYGGLETCLTAWLTTYTLRVTGGSLLGGQSGFVVLWGALTLGRALASIAMRRWSEATTQRVSLLCCFLLVVLLATTHSGVALAVICVALGLALAPVFPSTFAILLRRGTGTRTAGRILAISGLGAAIFPWLMGAISTATNSLRTAMIVPALLVPCMLGLSWKTVSKRTRFPTIPQPS